MLASYLGIIFEYPCNFITKANALLDGSVHPYRFNELCDSKQCCFSVPNDSFNPGFGFVVEEGGFKTTQALRL